MQYVGAESCSKKVIKYCTYTGSGMNSESQKKTLFPKHACVGCFLGEAGIKRSRSLRRPASRHANESSSERAEQACPCDWGGSARQARWREHTGCFTVGGGSCCCSSRSLMQMCGCAFNICTVRGQGSEERERHLVGLSRGAQTQGRAQ